MAGLEIIRVYSARAREGAAGFNARTAKASLPARILVWLIAIPIALVLFALAALVVIVVSVLLLARAAARLVVASLRSLLNGRGSAGVFRNDGRRNVRVIRRGNTPV